jgi:hypothetical protein
MKWERGFGCHNWPVRNIENLTLKYFFPSFLDQAVGFAQNSAFFRSLLGGEL